MDRGTGDRHTTEWPLADFNHDDFRRPPQVPPRAYWHPELPSRFHQLGELHAEYGRGRLGRLPASSPRYRLRFRCGGTIFCELTQTRSVSLLQFRAQHPISPRYTRSRLALPRVVYSRVRSFSGWKSPPYG
jgi:hypothetical protein